MQSVSAICGACEVAHEIAGQYVFPYFEREIFQGHYPTEDVWLDYGHFFVVPNIDPIEEPFTNEDCVKILECSNVNFISTLDDCFRSGAVNFASSLYPRFKFCSFWDIMCIALTLLFEKLGAGRNSAIGVASFLVDEFASEYDVYGQNIAIDQTLINIAFSSLKNDSIHLSHDFSTLALVGIEIQVLLISISGRCAKIISGAEEALSS
jgi:hypothetical protein